MFACRRVGGVRGTACPCGRSYTAAEGDKVQHGCSACITGEEERNGPVDKTRGVYISGEEQEVPDIKK